VTSADLLYLKQMDWRTPGTRYNMENISPTVKHDGSGGGGIMVWRCFSGK